MADELSIEPGRVVVDLGAGTGKLTRLLVPFGSSLTAVEPLANMRAELVASTPGVVVHEGTAETMPFADASVDVVVAAHAAHWFERPAFLHEVARVLRPGGGLALLWNDRSDALPWFFQLDDVIKAGVELPWERDIDWADEIGRSGAYGSVVERRFPHEQVLDLEGLLDLVATRSYVASRPASEQAEVFDGVRRRVAGIPQPFTLPYVTTVHLCRSLSNAPC